MDPIHGNVTKVKWNIPVELSKRYDLVKTNIYRSNYEQFGYSKIDSINTFDQNNNFVTYYLDRTEGNGRDKYYLVTLSDANEEYESSFILTFFELTPREKRLIGYIRSSIPKVIDELMTEQDYQAGLNLAIQWFNIIPPVTSFTINNLDKNLEPIIVLMSNVTVLLTKYLPISIRDFSYSIPSGISLNIDRGEKIRQAINNVTELIHRNITQIKWEYCNAPVALGTIPLPLSLGGMLHRGILNLLNVFQFTFM